MSDFANAGFEVIATGGSCSAWYKRLDDAGAHILITGIDGCSHELADESDAFIVGVHWTLADGSAAWSDCLDAKTVAEAIEAANRAQLAFAFAAQLAADIGPDNLQTAIERNASDQYLAHGSCASHDFCDANMTMLAAWVETFGSEPAFLNGDESADAATESDASLDRMNAAWTFAKESRFFTVSAN